MESGPAGRTSPITNDAGSGLLSGVAVLLCPLRDRGSSSSSLTWEVARNAHSRAQARPHGRFWRKRSEAV